MGITDLLLQKGERDLTSERGVSCDGELPAASDPQLVERAKAARSALGSKAMVLGHHYQRDEVIAFADIRGDSFKLAQAAADNSDAEFIFFCGVHFMAESADILTTIHFLLWRSLYGRERRHFNHSKSKGNSARSICWLLNG